MRRPYKNRCTVATPVGAKVQEKQEQLRELAYAIEDKLQDRNPRAHTIYTQAFAFKFEDISAYFAMVDEEVRQRGIALARVQKAEKAAESLQSLKRLCAGCGYAWPYGEWCGQRCYERAKRRMMAGIAFAELGRIVGEHAGAPCLDGRSLDDVIYPKAERVCRVVGVDRGDGSGPGTTVVLGESDLAKWPVLTETAPARDASGIRVAGRQELMASLGAPVKAKPVRPVCDVDRCGVRVDLGPGQWEVWECDAHWKKKLGGG